MAYFKLNKGDKKIVDSIVKKLVLCRKNKSVELPLLKRVGIERMLTPYELAVAYKFLEINLEDYGIKTPFIGIEEKPANYFVSIKNQKYVSRFDGKKKTLYTQYIPRAANRAFEKMNRAMTGDIGRELLILSGYRSPWYQLLVFIELYSKNQYRASRTLKWVALPGHTQHGDYRRTALDIMTQDGAYKAKHFPGTDEYRWLIKNAKKFGFTESYPKNNKEGISYEPWHWRYTAKK